MISGQLSIETKELSVDTSGEIDIIDITDELDKFVHESGIREGRLTVFHPGSTAAIITTEYEHGLIEDLKKTIARIIPRRDDYLHDRIDTNARSHLRATFLQAELTIPIIKGRLVLGTWQQVALVDLDVRPRRRRVVLQIMGIL